MFWIDAEKTSLFDDVLEELACFAREIKILWTY
jgi:hypothetical protein